FTKKKLDSSVKTIRTIQHASISRGLLPNVFIFTFKSEGFLWEQVRRIVAYLLSKYADNNLEKELKTILETGKQPNLTPAPANGLILWDVVFKGGITWKNLEGCLDQFTKIFIQRYRSVMQNAMLYFAVHESLNRNYLEK
ncbi:MAG: hypothetical protein ACTSRA_20225, partial [Promethearchaeota archaeon]